MKLEAEIADLRRRGHTSAQVVGLEALVKQKDVALNNLNEALQAIKDNKVLGVVSIF